MEFSPSDYGPAAARILSLGGHGLEPMPLLMTGPNAAARSELESLTPRNLFPSARSPEGALAGLWVYFSCEPEAHALAQNLDTPEGSFWHGIVHRREPDAWNAGYWFRRVGRHPIFPALRDRAEVLGYPAGSQWDPLAFINFCEAARLQSGSNEHTLAQQVQLAEWQLLFDYCAKGIDV